MAALSRRSLEGVFEVFPTEAQCVQGVRFVGGGNSGLRQNASQVLLAILFRHFGPFENVVQVGDGVPRQPEGIVPQGAMPEKCG